MLAAANGRHSTCRQSSRRAGEHRAYGWGGIELRRLGPFHLSGLLLEMLLVGLVIILALAPGRMTVAGAQQPGDASQLRELAEQLLVQPYGPLNQVQTTELLPGQQPSGLSLAPP
jgi:hypothetical protein